MILQENLIALKVDLAPFRFSWSLMNMNKLFLKEDFLECQRKEYVKK